ncbi:Bug family tripartite tricarboxylate transporter substrate binding protein, partial [Saccharopolyspora hordei]|uniref:Bug family tripartite tricarboxylate transporter substrate binding protein n=1 Tax=Saccharopolyspora hordei TaxID=1838 RepID=UPI0035E5BAE7
MAAQDAAENFPERLITTVVPFPPGGAADTFARLLSEQFEQRWGQATVVENRPGGGGIVATRHVVGQPADGYTFLIVTVGHAVNPSLQDDLPYDTLNDLTPVAMVARLPSVLVVNAELEVETVADLVDMARANPGGLTFGSSGNATTSHVAGALFTTLADVDMLHVPYSGSAPAITDLIGGQIDMMIDPVLSSAQHVETGRLRALAVSTSERSELVPDLPTLAEAGIEGYDFGAWFMLLAPAGAPEPIVEKVNASITEMLSSDAMMDRLAGLGAEPVAMDPAELQAFLEAEIERYAEIMEAARMRVDSCRNS